MDVPLILPALGILYEALAPVAEAALRVMVGLALVPHGLRMTFGFFRDTGLPIHNLTMLSASLDRTGWRPGKFWAPAISFTQLVCGPLLAVGLFTRLAAIPVVLFLITSNIERWRVGGWFWNKLGVEYTLLWTLAAIYFLFRGGGPYSLDRLLGFAF
jgi:putative oxidoreductase